MDWATWDKAPVVSFMAYVTFETVTASLLPLFFSL